MLSETEREGEIACISLSILQSPFLASYQLSSASQPKKCSRLLDSILLRYRENRRKGRKSSGNNSLRTGTHGILPYMWLVLSLRYQGIHVFSFPWDQESCSSLSPPSSLYFDHLQVPEAWKRSEKKLQLLPRGSILSSASPLLYYGPLWNLPLFIFMRENNLPFKWM